MSREGATDPSEPGSWPAADRIVREIGPRRVLVLGAGAPEVVRALSEQGVETTRAKRPDGASHDLALWLDAPGPLDGEALDEAIRELCRCTRDVLLVPSPARPRSFWVERLGAHGLAPDLEFDARVLGPLALRFREPREAVAPLDALLDQRDLLLDELEALRHGDAAKEQMIADLHFDLLAVQHSVGWKALEAVRRVRARLAPGRSRRATAYHVVRRVMEVLVDDGVRTCVRRSLRKLRLIAQRRAEVVRIPGEPAAQDLETQYEAWLARSPRRAGPAPRPGRTSLISVVMPVHDAEEAWLDRAVESVRAQVSPAWELWLVDDASTRPHVARLLERHAAQDARIRVTRLASRGGPAAASNHGLTLATGPFVAFLDPHDELSPDALLEMARCLDERPDLDVVYSDEDRLAPDGRRVEPWFKPGFGPDLLLSTPYVGQLAVYRRALLERVGGFRPEVEAVRHHDLVLRLSEATDRIAHVPQVLYHARPAATRPGAAAAWHAGRRAVEAALQRRGWAGRVERGHPGAYVVRYALRGSPLVSIMIPTRDRWQLLRDCLRSLEEKTLYPRYEVVVIDNGSREPETLAYLDAVAARWRVLRCPEPFNFSALNNRGAREAAGEILVFLNNDVHVIRGDWLTAMLEHAQRPEVGAVGAKLVYPTGRIQHAGVVLGVGGLAGHAFKGLADTGISYGGLADVVRDCSAVTAACLMTRRQVFEEVGGFDEQLRVALNDVDLCLRMGQRGYRVVYTPLARLYHHESASRGRRHPHEDEALFLRRWGHHVDPHYNPNLTLTREDWSLGI